MKKPLPLPAERRPATSLRVPERVPPTWSERWRLRWSAALARRLLAYFPGNTATRTDLGDVLWLLGRYEEAIVQYDASLQYDPQQAHCHLRAGVALMALGQVERALRRFQDAVKLAPQAAEPHYRKAVALGRLGQWDESNRSLERAAQLDPADARVPNQRAAHALVRSHFEQALRAADEALALAPQLAAARSNRAAALLGLLRFNEAEHDSREAIRLDPDLASAHANLGLAMMWQQQPAEALAEMARAQRLQFDPLVSFVQAYCHLLYGQWQQGWPLLEARWQSVLKAAMPQADRPLWDGQAPLAGRTFLIHREQGLGDVVQFSRYAVALSQAGAKVILHAPKELVRLLQTLPAANISVVAADQPVGDFDLRLPIMSLPGALGTTPHNVPLADGYLSVPDDLARRWAQRMGPKQGLRVGLVWSGGVRPDQPELAVVNARRNIPLKALAGLNRPDIAWYSLQKGKEALAEWRSLRDQRWSGPAMIDLMDEAQDFADTAAIIQQLDLVITVDTSTAHVAAALGKPVWVLNRYDSCWRWGIDGETTPWYSSMRIFRPHQPHEPREALVAQVASALDSWVAEQPVARPVAEVA